MSDSFLKALDWDTLVCFIKGLVEVAKVDGIQPGEREYIEAFYHEEISHTENPQTLDFETLSGLEFNRDEAKKLLNNDKLKESFLKSCVMLACIDYFSEDERVLIESFASTLEVNDAELERIISEVQQEILAQFSHITIYSDSLKEIAKRIGVKDFSENQ